MVKKQRKQLNIQRNLIVILLVVLIYAISGAVTYAWYTRFVQQSTSITLSNPVEIYIVNDEEGTPIGGNSGELLPQGTLAYPGTKINLYLGFVMGQPDKISSPAYVRVKINVTSDAFVDIGGEIVTEGLIDYDTTPNPDNWLLAEFNDADHSKWYVFSQKIDNIYSGRIALNGQIQEFIDGVVSISKELTNVFANKQINITFTVSAIQSTNIQDPLKNATYNPQKQCYENAAWGVYAPENPL